MYINNLDCPFILGSYLPLRRLRQVKKGAPEPSKKLSNILRPAIVYENTHRIISDRSVTKRSCSKLDSRKQFVRFILFEDSDNRQYGGKKGVGDRFRGRRFVIVIKYVQIYQVTIK